MQGDGNREGFTGGRAEPYLVTALALALEYAAMLLEQGTQRRIEATAHA